MFWDYLEIDDVPHTIPLAWGLTWDDVEARQVLASRSKDILAEFLCHKIRNIISILRIWTTPKIV